MSQLEILSKLVPLMWRTIEVPARQNSMSGGSRLVEHQQWGVPGAHIENTGRKAERFTFTIPFRNGIWGYNDLYPGTFRKFFSACLDTTVGKLVHPEFGELDAHVSDRSVRWDPKARDGCDMEVTWVETNENATLEQAPQITDKVALAEYCEEIMHEIDAPEFDDGSGLSLAETLAKLASMKLLLDMRAAAALAKVESAINGVNNLISAISSIRDPKSWNALDALGSIESSLQDLKNSAPGAGTVKKVAAKTTTKELTPTQTAAAYGMEVNEFFALNPRAALSSTIAIGTTVYVTVATSG